MGMTIWIHTLEERNYSQDSEDHSMMNRHADALDTVCEAAGVRKLSEFLDFTDMNFNSEDFSDDDDYDDEAGDPTVDPETGLAYGIDDMSWFDAAEGLLSMKAMRSHLETAGLAGLEPEQKTDLIEELDDCIAVLDGPAARGGKFHLALIE